MCQSRFNGQKDFIWQFSLQRLPSLLAEREKMVTTQVAPTLTIASKAFGQASVKLIIRSHLHAMALAMGITSTPDAIDGIIEDILSGYGDFKITELLLAFKMIREGKFRDREHNRGSFYGVLSSSVICDCLYQFRFGYRNEILSKAEQQEQQQKKAEEKPASYEEYRLTIINSIIGLRQDPEKMGKQFKALKHFLNEEDMKELEKYVEEQQMLLSNLNQIRKQVADLEYMQKAIKTTATITEPAKRDACFARLLELANQYDDKYAPLEDVSSAGANQ